MIREVMAIVESARHLLLFDNQKKEGIWNTAALSHPRQIPAVIAVIRNN